MTLKLVLHIEQHIALLGDCQQTMVGKVSSTTAKSFVPQWHCQIPPMRRTWVQILPPPLVVRKIKSKYNSLLKIYH